ncbi:MAG TPA: transglycosylase domain-containing protein [Ktedonobacteraceae bacterium]|nr:transglycosylase domain-containing protein [Ktedonobacteraceae bacterium]
MSNNYWQPQNNQNSQAGSEHPPRKSGLLSTYARQQPSMPGAPPASPLPPTNNSTYNGGPAPTYRPEPMQQSSQQLPPPQQAQWNGPAFMARPMQMVQRWSNKMAAMRRPPAVVDPNPLVRYHNPQPSALPGTPPPPLPQRWQRSRTQRIAHLRKRRIERWRRGPGKKRVSTIVFSVIGTLLLIIVSSTASYALNFYQSELPHVQNLSNMQIPQSTHIYDRHGTLLFTLYDNTTWGLGGRSTPISYNFLPRVLQDAQTAAEDPSFWTNNGIDPQGMIRALQQYISAGGQVQSGGSTMTQQLIKNLSNNNQVNFQRKASEAALAIGLTQQFPKWKIMEMYFNDTPYGAQEKGVEAAAEDYFGLMPQCDDKHHCTPGIAFLDRDLAKCKVTKPKIDETTCEQDPMLALARSAVLAGIPQNPTHLDPSVNKDNFQNIINYRVPYVINQMVQNHMSIDLGLGDKHDDKGVITEEMGAKIKDIVSKMKIVGFHGTELAPHFVNWVIQTLSVSLGNGDADAGLALLKTSGFNIYTTLDLKLEQFVEKDVKHNLRDLVCQPYTGCGPLNTVYNVNDAAAVVMDAKTGEVLAMNGSTDYNDKNKKVAGSVNAAISPRQPGSSIKPIVYAAAFMKGWYPGIKLLDGKTYFPNGGSQSAPVEDSTYHPTDYQQSYHPNLPTNIRISLQNSFNIPAIKAFMYAGIDSVVDMARRLGITGIDQDLAAYNAATGEHNTMGEHYGPSMALGTPSIPLIQMVGAYQTFANNGVHVPYHNILDIWDNYGRNLYHYDPTHPNGIRVLTPQVTFLLNNMLSDEPSRHYEFAGVHTLSMLNWEGDHPVAAKTGTTENFVDNWTLGFTTSLVVGVWAGNADGGKDPMSNQIVGISGAGPTWNDIIEYASGRSMLGVKSDPSYLKKYPTDPFPVPSGVVQASVNPVNGLQGTGVTDWMLDGEQPQQTGITCSTTSDPNNPPTGKIDPNTGCPTMGTPNGDPNGHGNPNMNGDPNGYGDPNGNPDMNGYPDGY